MNKGFIGVLGFIVIFAMACGFVGGYFYSHTKSKILLDLSETQRDLIWVKAEREIKDDGLYVKIPKDSSFVTYRFRFDKK